ncbi:hypothetical protein B0H10DRAFT_2203144 [Mycena sp. CBHHK59/15]|nr:hypothetical protein B0H10DRAFT_2203144 [Mycena sp. CBHHK59/15]
MGSVRRVADPFRRAPEIFFDGTATGRFERATAVEMTAVTATGRHDRKTVLEVGLTGNQRRQSARISPSSARTFCTNAFWTLSTPSDPKQTSAQATTTVSIEHFPLRHEKDEQYRVVKDRVFESRRRDGFARRLTVETTAVPVDGTAHSPNTTSITARELAHSMRYGQEFRESHDPTFEFSRTATCKSSDLHILAACLSETRWTSSPQEEIQAKYKSGYQPSAVTCRSEGGETKVEKSMIKSIRVRSESSVDYGEIHRVEILLYSIQQPPVQR